MNLELTRADFEDKGNHQWTAYRDKYSYVIRQVDGAFEVIIRPILKNDPTLKTWEDALRLCNLHVRDQRIANRYEVDYKEFDK